MIEKPPIPDQRIIDCLNTSYSIEVVTLTFLPLGADLNAAAYKAQAHDQSSYFVKLKRGQNHDISTTIVTLLHDAGIRQIILPIKPKCGQPTQRIDDFTLVVSPFIEGQNAFSHKLTDDQWLTLGKVMKQVHEINVPPSVQTIIRRETFSPKWREAVQSLLAHIEAELSGDETALKLQTFMKNHTATIHRLVERAEQLGQKIQHQSPENVLCHSDIHGGNVLIDKNGAIYIVDWDDPIMAPKERDLMFIGGGIANVWNKPHEEELFYKGYGKTKINTEILTYYRHERIVEDIAIIAQQLLLSTAGNQDRMESYKHFVAQFDPQGVVEIAFKTDDDR